MKISNNTVSQTIEELQHVFKNKQNFEKAIFPFSSKINWKNDANELKEIGILLSEKQQRNMKISNMCIAFNVDLIQKMNSLKHKLIDKIDNIQTKENKIEYIKNKINVFDEIKSNAFNLLTLEYDMTLITQNKIDDFKSVIEYVFNYLPDISENSQLRTTDDLIHKLKNYGDKISKIKFPDKSVIEQKLRYYENVHEDEFYLLQLSNCILSIKELEYALMSVIFTKEEISQMENEGIVNPQFNYNHKSKKNRNISFEDIFKNPQNAEPCLNILTKLNKPYIDNEGYYIGKNKGIIALWIKVLRDHKLLKYFSDSVYKDVLDKRIIGLNLSKDASEFRRNYARLKNGDIENEIIQLLSQLSQLSQSGKLGK